MILAVVGGREFRNPRWERYAHAVIMAEVMRLSPSGSGRLWDQVITGDAPGIDTLAATLCRLARMPCLALAPQNRRWEPDGYKARNILVAERCDELLCIRDRGARTYGSGWTADYAEGLGKPVTRVEIS